MKISIEQHDPKYNDDIRRLVTEFYEEALKEYNTSYSPETIDQCIEQYASGMLLLVNNGKCEGILAGAEVQNPVTGEKVFQEVIWYVNKKFRHFGVTLLKKAEAILKERGYKGIIMACMHNSKTEKLFTFYRRMGFVPLETHFLRRL
jgi:GNAT superfamily N-acetyltransferase